MAILSKGKKFPKFSLLNQEGEEITEKTLLGKRTIVFFYPKDNTPTCTQEACNFRDNHKDLMKKGFQVIGVSPDSVKKHQNFIKKFSLPYDLLVDDQQDLSKACGVWAEKQMFGKKYMGILRTTFVIDPKGKIELVVEKVKAKESTDQILQQLSLSA